VQYTYSLLGRRDLKPEKRVSFYMPACLVLQLKLKYEQPEKITTAAGNEIKVNYSIWIVEDLYTG